MPSRPAIALILAAWVATLGWFTHRELWPILFPGDAPPFVIELADEVTSQLPGDLKRPDVLWGIYRDDKRIGQAETRLRYFGEDNTYEMETRVSKLKLMELVEIPEMFNAYRLSPQGELRRLRMNGTMTVMGLAGKASFTGEVRDGLLYRTGEVTVPILGKVVPNLDPVEAPKGSVLNPMHPVPKIKGLRPGRRWRMPIINPLGDAIEPTLRAVYERLQPGQKFPFKFPTGPQFLDAEVLTETEDVEFNLKTYPCRIIEYRGEERPARTYVRISDGAVMRQEAFSMGAKIELRRE